MNADTRYGQVGQWHRRPDSVVPARGVLLRFHAVSAQTPDGRHTAAGVLHSIMVDFYFDTERTTHCRPNAVNYVGGNERTAGFQQNYISQFNFVHCFFPRRSLLFSNMPINFGGFLRRPILLCLQVELAGADKSETVGALVTWDGVEGINRSGFKILSINIFIG